MKLVLEMRLQSAVSALQVCTLVMMHPDTICLPLPMATSISWITHLPMALREADRFAAARLLLTRWGGQVLSSPKTACPTWIELISMARSPLVARAFASTLSTLNISNMRMFKATNSPSSPTPTDPQHIHAPVAPRQLSCPRAAISCGALMARLRL